MIPDMFAMDTSASGLPTEAKAGIWADYDDFSAKAATTAERAEALERPRLKAAELLKPSAP